MVLLHVSRNAELAEADATGKTYTGAGTRGG